MLTYAAYKKAAEDAARGAAGPAAAALLTARAFLRLAGSVASGGERGGKGGEGEKPTTASSAAAAVVDVESLCDYLGQRAGQLQMHVHLSCFDAGGGAGWLSEAGAAAFVRATLPQLARSGCGDSFEGKLSLEDHAAIAARKLVFFHGRSGGVGSGRDGDEGGGGGGGGGGKRLRIRDVLAGRALAELLELAAPAAAAPSSIDDDYQQQQQQQASPPGGGPSNWFSAASAAAAAAAFASGATAGVEAAAAAGVDLSEARVDFPFTRLRGTETPASSTANIAAAEAASFGSLGIPAAALCELGDGTLSPLFAARLVEEKGDARALIAVFASSSSSSPDSPAPSSSSRAEGEEGESCSDIDEENNNGNNSGKEEGVGEQDGDEMNVDGRKSRRHRQRKRRNPPPLQPPPPPQPPSLATTAGLSLPSFLDFLLAWSDRNDPKSVSWLWPALDLRGQGSLTRLDVERLFEPVRRLWVERGQYDALRSCDVAAEVFDIVAPSRPGHDEVITKRDLCGCPMAGSVIGMLCDVVRRRKKYSCLYFFFELFFFPAEFFFFPSPSLSRPFRSQFPLSFFLSQTRLDAIVPLHSTGMLLRARLAGAPAAAGHSWDRRPRRGRGRRRLRRARRRRGTGPTTTTRGGPDCSRREARRGVILCQRRCSGDGRRGVRVL